MKERISSHLGVLIYIGFCFISRFLYPNLPIKMELSLLVIPLIVLEFYLINFIKFTLNKWVIIVWLWFFPFGLLNISNSYINDPFWNLKVNEPSYLYLLFLISFTLFVLSFENFHAKRKFRTIGINPSIFKRDTNSLLEKLFIIFPLIWFISLFLNLGFIPILSGNNIVADIYELNYGVLHNYIVFISVSVCLLFVHYYKNYNSPFKRRFVVAVIILFLLLSFADGKRYTILTSLLAVFIYYSFYIKRVSSSKFLYIIGGVGGVIYTFIQAVREGNISTLFSTYISKIGIGVEFRDYVYTFNHFNPGKIKGYNYELSVIGSLTNRTLAELIGIDKDKLSAMGSAYTWKNIYYDLFGTEFGIRTGLFSELYFAYSFWGIIVLGLFAGFLTYISTSIENRTKKPFETIIFSIIYALFILLIVGQSTAFFGQVIVLIYALIFNRILKIIINGKKSIYNHSRL